MRFRLFLFLLLFQNGLLWAQTGRNYALLFHGAAYDDPDWPKLPETVEEVGKISVELSEHYGYTVEIGPMDSRESITDKISRTTAALKPEDRLVVFFSCHGYYNKQTRRGYLVPKNAKPGDPAGLTLLSYDDLGSLLTVAPCRQVLLLLDACYSGSFGERNRGRPDEAAFDREQDCQTRIQQALKYPSRLFAAAGNKDSKTPAKSRFASKVIEALRRNPDLLTWRALRAELLELTHPEAEFGSFPGHEEGGDFVFVRRGACQATAATEGEGPAPTTPVSGRTPPDDKFVFVRGNMFIMGNKNTNGPEAEEPEHFAQVKSFWISPLEVTAAEFKKFVDETGYRTDAEKGGKVRLYNGVEWVEPLTASWRWNENGTPRVSEDYQKPVCFVSWNDATEYARWLSTKTGQTYRLPTEAEWEFAARGGSQSRNTLYAGSENIDEVAWYAGNAESRIHRGGLKKPNELGLYDMTGNVFEWCSDWYDPQYYHKSPVENPRGPSTGTERAIRWGAYYNSPEESRITYRYPAKPSESYGIGGFRLVRD